MFGELEHEAEVDVPASEAWDLFGSLRIAKLMAQEHPHLQNVEVIEGDGGVGTILKLTFTPDFPGPSSYKEKFTKIDNEKRMKETETVEGGYLELGFTVFRIRFQVIEKGDDSSIIKLTMEYELKDESAAMASLLNTQTLAEMASIAKIHLNKNKLAPAKEEK